jgi:hypothetical protein
VKRISGELLDLGHDTLDRLSSEVAVGASLLHCQLLASEFYERLKREERVSDCAGGPLLEAAREQLERAAAPGAGPIAMLVGLRRTLAALQAAKEFAPRPVRPALRVIDGGLAGSREA